MLRLTGKTLGDLLGELQKLPATAPIEGYSIDHNVHATGVEDVRLRLHLTFFSEGTAVRPAKPAGPA